MADGNSKPIPEHWKLVVGKKNGGSSLLYYTCPETGQKFFSYEYLMRYVNFAKAAKLSIYSPDFSRNNGLYKGKTNEGATDVNQMEQSSDLEDSTLKLPSITSPEFMEASSSSQTDKQSSTGKSRSKNWASNEASSSNKGKGKKQKT